MKTRLTKLILTVLAVAATIQASANNIIVSNAGITNQNAATQTIFVKHDLSWENSWRVSTGPTNWDAAWVFVKFHTGDGVWRHASLSTVGSDHVVPSGAALDVGLTGAKGVGVFIYRSANGSGSNYWPGINLKWLYGQDGVSNTALVTVDVTAIEMVYVPQGSFFVGDGNSGGTYSTLSNGTNNAPFQITGTGAIVVTGTNGALWATQNGGGYFGSSFIIPATFPNGFNAFYCMKYEVSQGQYADFANKSPSSFLPNNAGTTRQTFSGSAPNITSSSPDRAFALGNGSSSLGYSFQAYLDWTGLRPMSEFEYEKACRGPVFPVPGEFAWGTGVGASLIYTLANDGTSGEAVSANYNENAGNNWNNTTRGGLFGPARVGMFAKASYNGTTSGRIQSGASYFGIMDMTGNVGDLYSRLPNYSGDATQLAFTGQHGDGQLTAGQANVSAWAGAYYSGGGTFNIGNPLQVSSLVPASVGFDSGIRGVRTAP